MIPHPTTGAAASNIGSSPAAPAWYHKRKTFLLRRRRGFLNVVNGTPYDWVVTSTTQHKMKSWDTQWQPNGKYLRIPKKGGSSRIYIEWGSGSHPGGDVGIHMEGTDYRFMLHAWSNRGFYIWAEFQTFSVQGYSQGANDQTGLNVNWIHDGDVAFILSGENPGNFFPSNGPIAWMQASLGLIGNRPLRKLCIPGSHDSGMAIKNGSGTIGATSDNSLTQWQNIHGQLVAGARYFDVRPCIGKGNNGNSNEMMCGHYSNTNNSTIKWQGVSGEYIQDVINSVNRFLVDEGNRELVIINLSHAYNTNHEWYRDFTPEEWERVLDMFTNPETGLKNLWKMPKGVPGRDPATAIIWDTPLKDFIAGGPAVVIISEDFRITSDSRFSGQGIFNRSQYDVRNEYSNSDKNDHIMRDQFTKMLKHGFTTDRLFLLSWTYSLQGAGNLIQNLRKKADDVNRSLYTTLPPKCNPQTFPNIIYVDSFGGWRKGERDNGHNSDQGHYSWQGRNMASLAMAINWITSWNDGPGADNTGNTLQAQWESLRNEMKNVQNSMGTFGGSTNQPEYVQLVQSKQNLQSRMDEIRAQERSHYGIE
ncbi:hypothetical protein TWF217_006141 [Orbilia oligospora]|nr:hypothetical protein TWF128_007185 [Orbilia oligospora]KAF3256819.1 hypothetical protein TWF217_006141 [Orbilia oligospora]KAF3296874.1 hypothetical protein TWF132_009373 [Orbilia oligospora]